MPQLESAPMALANLVQKKLRLIFFGGKGGVGKTTCASAAAIYFALHGKKTTLLSSDPAHSLSDSLQVPLIGRTRIPGVPLLTAEEIDAQKAIQTFRSKFRDEIMSFFLTSTNLDEEDALGFLDLPLPGLDELMSLKVVVDYLEQKRETEIFIMDTSPTGHTLRLLAVPEMVDDWIRVFAKMRWKYRYVVKRFSGKYDMDKVDEMLLNLKKTLSSLKKLLRDPNNCEFVIVTNPRIMVIRETERLIEALLSLQIPLGNLIVNNVTENACGPIEEHREIVRDLLRRYPRLSLTWVPQQPTEVLGVARLRLLAARLFEFQAGAPPDLSVEEKSRLPSILT